MLQGCNSLILSVCGVIRQCAQGRRCCWRQEGRYHPRRSLPELIAWHSQQPLACLPAGRT
jgi:hypothetical protein